MSPSTGTDEPRGRHPGPVRSVIVEVCCVVGALTATGLLHGELFAGHTFLIPIVAAAVGGCGTAALARRRGTGFGVIAGALGFVALALASVVAARFDHRLPPCDAIVTDLDRGLLHGWSSMLDPGSPTAQRLLIPALLTWVAAQLATAAILRGTGVLLPAAPVLANLLATIPFATDQPGPQAPATAGFLAATAVLTASRATMSRVLAPTSGRRQRVGVAVSATVLVVGAGFTAGQSSLIASGTDRFDPRTVSAQHVTLDQQFNPLSQVKPQLQATRPRTLFTVRLSGPGAGHVDRVTLATLADYDGVSWSSDATFPARGTALTRDAGIRPSRLVRADIEIVDLVGQYLPTVGVPVRSSVSGLGFDPASGTLVARQPDRHGMRYTLTADVRPVASDTDTDIDLASAVVVDGRAGLLAAIPEEISSLAVGLAAADPSQVGKLQAIEGYLRALPYSVEAATGHNYARMLQFLSEGSTDRFGYAEQHAAAFALLARVAGFRTRVAVGYRLRAAGRVGDPVQVTETDVHAWPEVHLAGRGWVAFEPTDRSVTVLPDAPTTTQTRHLPSVQTPVATPPPPSPTASRAQPAPAHRSGTAGRVALAALALGGLLTVLPAMVVLEKSRRRRRRRRTGSNAARVLGAWQEAVDRLVEHGVPAQRTQTATETARAAAQRLGPAVATVDELATLADVATFAPDQPGRVQVQQAWLLATQLRHDLHHHRGAGRTLRAQLDPRPLTAVGRERRRERLMLRRLMRR